MILDFIWHPSQKFLNEKTPDSCVSDPSWTILKIWGKNIAWAKSYGPFTILIFFGRKKSESDNVRNSYFKGKWYARWLKWAHQMISDYCSVFKGPTNLKNRSVNELIRIPHEPARISFKTKLWCCAREGCPAKGRTRPPAVAHSELSSPPATAPLE